MLQNTREATAVSFPQLATSVINWDILLQSVCHQPPWKTAKAVDTGKQQSYKKEEVQHLKVDSLCHMKRTPSAHVKPHDNKMSIALEVNVHTMDFQLDTGATCSVIGLQAYQELGYPTCKPSKQRLKSYGKSKSS